MGGGGGGGDSSGSDERLRCDVDWTGDWDSGDPPGLGIGVRAQRVAALLGVDPESPGELLPDPPLGEVPEAVAAEAEVARAERAEV